MLRRQRKGRSKTLKAPEGELFLAQVLILLSVSRATFYRMVSAKKMPKPRRIHHDQRAVYSASEIHEAMRQLLQSSAR